MNFGGTPISLKLRKSWAQSKNRMRLQCCQILVFTNIISSPLWDVCTTFLSALFVNGGSQTNTCEILHLSGQMLDTAAFRVCYNWIRRWTEGASNNVLIINIIWQPSTTVSKAFWYLVFVFREEFWLTKLAHLIFWRLENLFIWESTGRTKPVTKLWEKKRC